MRALLATSLLLAAAPALGETAALKKALAPVSRAYQKLELDRALEHIQHARELAKTDDDRGLCSLYEGVVLAGMGRADDSNAAFRAALAVRVDAKLPLKVSTKLTAQFESLRAEEQQRRAQPPPPEPAPAPEVATPQRAPEAAPPAPGAALPHPAGILRIAAPDLQLVNVTADLGGLYAEHFAQHLASDAVSVVTSKKINALLGLERQRQLVGCGDSSCFLELANALGADAIVTGSIGRVGGLYQININIISSRDGATLSARSVQASSDEAVLQTLAATGEDMSRELLRKLRPKVFVGGRLRRLSWIPAVAGVAAGVVGGILLADAASTSHQLNGKTGSTAPGALSVAQGQQLVSQGQSQQLWGWVAAGGGVALLAAGAGMFLFGGAVEVSGSPAGAGVSVSGSF
jgi:hypothetical protein